MVPLYFTVWIPSHSTKASLSIIFKLLGNSMLLRLGELANATRPIFVIPSGIIISVKSFIPINWNGDNSMPENTAPS